MFGGHKFSLVGISSFMTIDVHGKTVEAKRRLDVMHECLGFLGLLATIVSDKGSIWIHKIVIPSLNVFICPGTDAGYY